MSDEQEQLKFRTQAVKHVSSPEQLDQPLKVVPLKIWLVLWGIFIFFIMVIFWSIFGRVNTVITAPCILYPSEGPPVRAVSFTSGIVSKVLVSPNELVKPNQELIEITQGTPPNLKIEKISNIYGLSKVINIGTSRGAWVSPGTHLVMLQPISPENTDLTGYAFISLVNGKKISPNMDIHIMLDQANPAVFGYLKGKIDWISLYPTTKTILENFLQNSFLTARFSAQGDPFEIKFHLIKNAKTSSGYQWTTKEGFPEPIQPGSTGTLHIIAEEQAPISFIFPRIHHEK